jgi:RNA polymerase sigma-70 factor (ECF subfamily)
VDTPRASRDEGAVSGASAGRASSAEKLWIERLRRGDEAAYEQLVRSYGGRMLAVAKRLLRSEDDARDAVQDAFLSAFRAIDRFEGESQLGTWLHRIVVNAALMKLRTRRRKPEEPLDDLLPAFLADGHMERPAQAWALPSDQALERAQLRQLVLDRIAELPETHRTILLLRDVEDLDTEEVARQLDISSGAVKTRLHRARQALRELLDPHLRTSAP